MKAGPDDVFERHRRLLFGTAYRMLGSVADAEDVVQDAWLRWAAVDQSRVEHPKAYLVRTVTNLSMNRLQSARAQREAYVGPWLPEPLLTTPDIADEAELADSVSMALLIVLETLSPLERAVFLLREVFAYGYGEIAAALDRAEPTVRQAAHRAREHVAARQPRFDTDAVRQRDVLEQFRLACAGGDINAVMALLAPDVTAWADGGGKISAARRPVHGDRHVAQWLLGVIARPDMAGLESEHAIVNGEPALRFTLAGTPAGAMTVGIADGRILQLRLVVNPDKLTGLSGGSAPPGSRGRTAGKQRDARPARLRGKSPAAPVGRAQRA